MKLPLFKKGQDPTIVLGTQVMNCEDYIDYLIQEELDQTLLRTGFAKARHNNPTFFNALKKQIEHDIDHHIKNRQNWNSFDELYYSNMMTIYKFFEVIQ